MAQQVRCERCGRVLHDAVSRALKMGPECRGDSGSKSKRHVIKSNKVHRGVAYATKTPVRISTKIVYTFSNGAWRGPEKKAIDDQRFGAWLKQFHMITPPADNLRCLIERKANAQGILKESRQALNKDQVKMIRSEIVRLGDEIKTFRSIVKKGGS